MIRALTALLLCGVAAPALAQHIQTVNYDENAVVSLTAQMGRSFDIKFSNDDRIKYFALGKIDGPLMLPPGVTTNTAPPAVHILPIMPTEIGTTNLVVITLMPDNYTERSYHFLIKVLPEAKEEPENIVYELRFNYSPAMQAVGNPQAQQVAQVQAVSWKEKKAKAEQEKAIARLRVDAFYGTRNWKYRGIGDKSIAPVPDGISDNGYLTLLRYSGNTEIPNVLIADGGAWCSDKAPPKEWLHSPEHPASTAGMKMNDFLQMNEVGAHLRLRLGTLKFDISNCGFDPIGHDPGTGTGSPDVVREAASR